MASKIRNLKGGGAVPVELPMMLFLYTIVFLVCIDFIMLFWLQSSLSTVAKQIAYRAATNSQLEPNDAKGRCEAAADSVNSFFPGYSTRVRTDFVNAVKANKTGYGDFNETANLGQLRAHLSGMGAERPSGFWSSDGLGNSKYGGCYGLRNPITEQVVYHTVIHCNRCWPVFLKLFSLSGWLEGRGSSPVIQAGANSPLNKSLLSSGPKAFLACSEESCAEGNQGSVTPNQNDILKKAADDGTDICSAFNDDVKATNPNRQSLDQVSIGHRTGVFAIDQWPTGQYNYDPANPLTAPRDDNSLYQGGIRKMPAGITRIANCGDIDPLILVGLRYACLGKDAFDHPLTTGPDVSASDPSQANYLGRCDQYFFVKPACSDKALQLGSSVGEITNLDGSNGPCIIRRKPADSSYTAILPRIDFNHTTANPWIGPYNNGPKYADDDFRNAMLESGNMIQEKTFDKNKKIDINNLKSLTTSTLVSKKNANPLESLAPYGAVCDICNPGSPMCGYYGTCRDEGNLWGGDVVLRLQAYFNEPWYGKSIAYTEIKAAYRRDCKEKHCCRGVDEKDPGILDTYCGLRLIKGGNTRTKHYFTSDGKTEIGSRTWTYKGVPNRTAQGWTKDHLPRLGNYPLCSSGAVQMLGNRVGECCTADVAPNGVGSCSGNCPDEKAPMVELRTPFEQFGKEQSLVKRTGCAKFVNVSGTNITWNPNLTADPATWINPDNSKKACGLRPNCAEDRLTNRWCPSKPPAMNGSCFNFEEENHPVGGEAICGPAFSYGLMGVPKGGDPTNTMCGVNLTSLAPSSDQCGSNSKETSTTYTGKECESVTAGKNATYKDSQCTEYPDHGKPAQYYWDTFTVTKTTKTECTTCTKCAGTPIYLSLDQSQPVILNKKVCFALDQTRNYLSYKWPKAHPKQGFLAIDWNKDGIINDGRELFGNLTQDVYYPNGYTALSVLFDKNNDMLITGSELEELLIWQDTNEDGISQNKELKKLKDLGIIELNAGKYHSEPQSKKFFNSEKDVSAIYYSAKGLKLKNKKISYTWDIDFRGYTEEKCRLQNNKKQITQNTFKNYWSSLKAFIGGLI